MTDFTLDQLIDVKERHADDLLALPGVTGVGVGHPDGESPTAHREAETAKAHRG